LLPGKDPSFFGHLLFVAKPSAAKRPSHSRTV
jgi:hypothetical protein